MEYTPIEASTSICRIRRIQSVIDQTSERYLSELRREDFETQYPYVDPSETDNQGAPLVWFQSGYDSNRNIKIKMYPVPEAARTILVTFTEEPLALVTPADVPRIPDQYHFGLTYLGLAKYYEFMKDPVASYYRSLHEDLKRKMLEAEFGTTDDMPQIKPMTPGGPVIQGKIGRVWNT
jgi:hypothetical protein